MPEKPKKPDDGLVETGKPDDPAKQENPDTRLEQLKPFKRPGQHEEQDEDPALETTRIGGQGTG